jgi:hypothetical protein
MVVEQRAGEKRVPKSGSNGIGIISQRLAQLNTELVAAQAASAAAGARYQQGNRSSRAAASCASPALRRTAISCSSTAASSVLCALVPPSPAHALVRRDRALSAAAQGS